MKRTLILYASTHHGNTRRLAETMAEAAGAELCDLLHDPLPDLSGYDLIIHCGACMFNRKYVLSRMEEARAGHVPMTNYGVTIAYLSGILDKIDLEA